MSDFSLNSRASSLYRAMWRWHFFAGLLTLPFLLWLAVTGGAYLFKDEINHLIYRDIMDVAVREAPLLSPGQIAARVEIATGGQVLQVAIGTEPGRAIPVTIRSKSREAMEVFADPYDGAVKDSIPYGGVMYVVKKLHSLLWFGYWPSLLIEISAGWAMILVASGIYLWWPRGVAGGVVTVRATPKARMFWRDLHAVTGIFAGAVIFFLALTGMPWSKFWGDRVQHWNTQAGLGSPRPPAPVVRDWQFKRGPLRLPGEPKLGEDLEDHEGHDGASEHRHHAVTADVPWALEKSTPPKSEPSTRAPIGLDKANEIAAAAGLRPPYTLAPPVSPKGVYFASFRPGHVEDTRLLYIDQYSGKIIADLGYAQYGAGARAIEWGIATHQGMEYGAFNRYLMLAGCLALALLAISAPVMWWKRRPSGALAIPPAPANPKVARGVALIMLVAGATFPLTGVTMIAALLIEFGLARLRPGKLAYEAENAPRAA